MVSPQSGQGVHHVYPHGVCGGVRGELDWFAANRPGDSACEHEFHYCAHPGSWLSLTVGPTDSNNSGSCTIAYAHIRHRTNVGRSRSNDHAETSPVLPQFVHRAPITQHPLTGMYPAPVPPSTQLGNTGYQAPHGYRSSPCCPTPGTGRCRSGHALAPTTAPARTGHPAP